tara:strand:- start:59 stop:637 length:579 start_codon:yes stop_codon:yes gene_type:complete
MVMIRNRKTVKGKLGKTRPKDTDFAGIARKQSRTKKTTTKSNRPTDSRTATLRKVLKEKQKLAGKGLGQAGQAFLGGSAKQTPVSPKKKPTVKSKPKPPKKTFKKITPKAGEYRSGNVLKNIVENQRKANRMKAGGKTSKYRMAGGGKTSKYRMAGGGKTSKYRMKGGGKTSKYMAKGGKTSKYMARGGRAR